RVPLLESHLVPMACRGEEGLSCGAFFGQRLRPRDRLQDGIVLLSNGREGFSMTHRQDALAVEVQRLGIDVLAVLLDVEVEMGSGRTTRGADIPDHLKTLDGVADLQAVNEAAEVGIA